MLFIIGALIFLIVVILLVILIRYYNADRKVVTNRLEHYVNKKTEVILAAKSIHESQQADSWRALVRKISKYVDSPQWTRIIEHKLLQAGVPMRSSEFLVICLGSSIVGSILLFVFSGGNVLMSLVGMVIGFYLPILVLKIKIARRTKLFNEQLGDTLILVANSLRTGYSFMQAMEMVSREMPKPIGEEFGRVLKEMNLGVTTEDAMNNLAKRVNSDDLDLVITAVLIQRQVGGNLSEVLDNIANTIRERVKIKGKIKTLTAQGRISGIIISILPIGIGGIIYLINPGYIGILFTHPIGKGMLAAGVVSQLMGIMFIRKIVDIDV